MCWVIDQKKLTWNLIFVIKLSFIDHQAQNYSISSRPEEKEDDLNGTDDGEPSEESHASSNQTQLSLHLDLLFSLNLVKGRCVKVDLYQLDSGLYLLT